MDHSKIKLLAVTGIAALLLSACERPPVDTTQSGYRGTGMVDVQNPRDPKSDDAFPPAVPAAPSGGPLARDSYQNVQVLGDLSVAEFTRLMVAITAWVSPEEGCNYCHEGANLASDSVYTKVVARRMIQMNQKVNSEWQSHVANTGVNCYTCHRGKPVPEYIWFEDDTYTRIMVGNKNGQNTPVSETGYTSLPLEPFSSNLTSTEKNEVRVQTAGMFPTGDGASIANTEESYSLMIHMSSALGVNCTYCHNTASFQNWKTSTPARVTAYHGLDMVRDLNENYLLPLTDVFPENRLGSKGDVAKVYCTTCHQGVNKPLNGAPAVADYPNLAKK